MNSGLSRLPALGLYVCLLIPTSFASTDNPGQAFLKPSQDAKLGVWWHWMGCNVSLEGITRDLESFKDAGISKATIFGMADVCTPWVGNIANSPGDATPVCNSTTRNGSGGAETLDEGKTFRPYGKGNSLLLKIDGSGGREIHEIQTFAGHRDARASQTYSVWIAKAGAPVRFIKAADARVISQGGATRLRVPIDSKDVVAVRFDFADGPSGFNVYREICLVGPVVKQAFK